MGLFFRNRRIGVVLLALLFYACALIATWNLSTRNAQNQTEGMLDYSMMDVRDTVNGAIDTMLMHIAESIVEELETASPLSHQDALRIIGQRDIDEINVLDSTGRNLGSSDARIVGTSMADKAKSSAFLILTTGRRRVYSQPFRAGAHNPDVRRKYLGVSFPDGSGFIQVGIDETHVRRMFPAIMGFIFDQWLLGKHGFFLCADLEEGRLISNPVRHLDEATYLAETGFNPKAEGVRENGETTFRQRLFGEECDCRSMVFAGHRIIGALPVREYYGTRSLYTAGMALILALVLTLFVSLLWRIDADSARLQTFYAAEAEKQAAELELGRTIQTAALPTDFPSNEYCCVAASMHPAREVGGDFYDFFWLDETHLVFLVADVSGKGITGALYMMNCKTLIKDSILSLRNSAPAEVLTQVNDELCRNNPAEMFVTAWVGILDLDTGRVSFANAGHNPPIVRRASGGTEWLKERSGCPLGCFDKVSYKGKELLLAPGDMVFLYTDGITEAVDSSGNLFGNDRLMSVVRNGTPSSGKDSLAVCDAVRAAVEGFAGNAQQADDMTLLAMHLRGFPERYVRTFPANDAVLQDASSFVEEKLSSMDCSDKARKEILVALDELLSNVVRCAKASGIAIELRFSRARHCLTMVISDDGKPFDPLRIPPPDISLPLEQRRHGGLGILIVRKTMDALSYQHAHGCNILTMRKSLS